MTKELKALKDPETRFFVGDCRDVLAKMPAGGVRLVFADPPFNNATDYGPEWNDDMEVDQYRQFTRDWMALARYRLTGDGSLWVNINDEHASFIDQTARDMGLHRINWCVWHYRFGQHQRSRFVGSKTHCFWFAMDPSEYVFHPPTVQSVRQQIGDIRAEPDGRVPMDVWGFERFWGRVQGNNEERRPYHENQLPEVYLDRIIRTCTEEGDLVVDPFNGSGTTTTVARALGRRSIGVDIVRSNAESARARTLAGAIRVVPARVPVKPPRASRAAGR